MVLTLVVSLLLVASVVALLVRHSREPVAAPTAGPSSPSPTAGAHLPSPGDLLDAGGMRLLDGTRRWRVVATGATGTRSCTGGWVMRYTEATSTTAAPLTTRRNTDHVEDRRVISPPISNT